MSRSRKISRDARRAASFADWFWDAINQIAEKEGRQLETDAQREVFLRELKRRGVIVEDFPSLATKNFCLSFRFDRLPPESQPEFKSLDGLFKSIGCPVERGQHERE